MIAFVLKWLYSLVCPNFGILTWNFILRNFICGIFKHTAKIYLHLSYNSTITNFFVVLSFYKKSMFSLKILIIAQKSNRFYIQHIEMPKLKPKYLASIHFTPTLIWSFINDLTWSKSKIDSNVRLTYILTLPSNSGIEFS